MFNAYFQEIGMTPFQAERAVTIVKYTEKIYNTTISDVVICDQVIEGERKFRSLWMTADGIFYEAKDFLAEIDIDMVKPEKIEYFAVKYWSCDPSTAQYSDDSRIFFRMQFSSAFNGQFNGVRNNIPHITRFVNEHFLALPVLTV